MARLGSHQSHIPSHWFRSATEFDVAGTTYTGGEVDRATLEESNDGGANWTTVVVMTNAVGDVLNTIGATQSGAFAPTAGQWASLSYGLSAGTNRVRFNGVSDFGNAVYLDNIAIGAAPTAKRLEVLARATSPQLVPTSHGPAQAARDIHC
ncbi:MAG: hypothetical protein IPI91_03940 [Flavobacteriales bacterium]|nr:hypothetical protein [Flavobacteriales bacterium]